MAVTPEMRQERAKQIAEILSNNERWHSHARGINMSTLVKELNLKIEDYGATKELYDKIHSYYDVFVDYLVQKGIPSFVHTRYHY